MYRLENTKKSLGLALFSPKMLSEELLSAREETRVAREKLAYSEFGKRNNGDCDFAIELSKVVGDLISEAQESKEVAQKLSFLVDETFQSFFFFAIIKEFVI
ncbi:hypothetical protein V6N13_138453 [Hibiscus sabdariffa]